MTPEEFEIAMKKIHDKEEKGGDREDCHIEADELMMKCLRRLGYVDGVDWFDRIGKWYS